jgi:predicted nucleotidyltransferase
MRQERLLNIIKKNILNVETDAEIYLYGPRAIGDSDPDANWDLLILLSHPVTEQSKRKIESEMFRVELGIGSKITMNIRQKALWFSEENQTQPFFKLIQKNAIKI